VSLLTVDVDAGGPTTLSKLEGNRKDRKRYDRFATKLTIIIINIIIVTIVRTVTELKLTRASLLIHSIISRNYFNHVSPTRMAIQHFGPQFYILRLPNQIEVRSSCSKILILAANIVLGSMCKHLHFAKFNHMNRTFAGLNDAKHDRFTKLLP